MLCVFHRSHMRSWTRCWLKSLTWFMNSLNWLTVIINWRVITNWPPSSPHCTSGLCADMYDPKPDRKASLPLSVPFHYHLKSLLVNFISLVSHLYGCDVFFFLFPLHDLGSISQNEPVPPAKPSRMIWLSETRLEPSPWPVNFPPPACPMWWEEGLGERR